MHYCFFSSGTWYRNASMGRFRDLGAELLKRGIRVTYLVDDLPHNRTEVYFSPGSKTEFVPNPASLSQFSSRRAILRRIKPDFVHVLNGSVKAMVTLLGVYGPKLVSDWDEWPAERASPHTFKRACLKWIERFFRGRAALVLVCSKHMEREFAARYGRTPVYLPYATYLTNDLNVPSPYSEPTAVYMGGLYAGYDHDVVFHAATLLKQRGLTPPIQFVGGGFEIDAWRKFVADRSLQNVTFTDYVATDDMWARIRHAHVLLFPIRSTPTNLSRCPAKTYAFAQAMRPVITCRVGEVPEVLGEKARYIEPTPEAFADAITTAMSRSQPDVDYAIERHNWSARADLLLEKLNQLHPQV